MAVRVVTHRTLVFFPHADSSVRALFCTKAVSPIRDPTLPQPRKNTPFTGVSMSRPGGLRLRRLIDGLEYDFDHQSGDAKESVYIRSDKAVKVIYDQDFGWSVWGEDDPDVTGERALLGRVWDVLVKDQGGSPTEGVWVSRKGEKAYVYVLEYLE
ncbi:hypothetical protein H2200_012821 [Cladophialophora chaetospira]|uniref:Uncharacterized protein n=1 Tax=Cladophialophora chaetospira TaxID=386627 RepID=A0AA39CBW9_9EURO|nr:hypothetical protein H2200_012821 [Cladophialophora chaetospira]